MYDVALIVPIFNTQDYLHRCIGSILTQRDVTLQCILIDDGSTDNSPDIAAYYQRRDRRVTFVSKHNEGQGPARNIGISIANSEYVYFVDSDDFLGDQTLAKIFEAAKRYSLDLCSPSVLAHYFAKPLELIACLPCKSQFMRRDILTKYDVRQPVARSGQDGVFSHLFLTHARRIGMRGDAQFNYTSSREGSTFNTYLRRSDVVGEIVEQHYEAIIDHYDRWDLWRRNALRLLEFIVDETLKNRILPHLANMPASHLNRCLTLLHEVSQRAVRGLEKRHIEEIGGAQSLILSGDFEKIKAVLSGEPRTITTPRKFNVSNNTTHAKTISVCKYLDSELVPVEEFNRRDILQRLSAAAMEEGKLEKAIGLAVRRVAHDFKARLEQVPRVVRSVEALTNKVDFGINATLNAAALSRLVLAPESIQPVSGSRIDAIVSLTSVESRLPMLPLVLESIFTQTLSPLKVVLWISDRERVRSAVGACLDKFLASGLDVRFVEDVGPHTKLMYALQEFPEKPIISLDDDMLYPFNTIQYLWDQHLKHKNAIIANWARELSFGADGKVLGTRSGRLLTPPLLEQKIEQDTAFVSAPTLLGFPYGTCGVLYPPGSLNERVFDVKAFQKLCPKEDDIWFKAMSLLNRTPVAVTNLGLNPPHYSVLGSQADALRHFNHGAQQNTKQIQAVFEHFDLYSVLSNMRAVVNA
jgi:glycosyltransferase involved in cell wall biosynthesis